MIIDNDPQSNSTAAYKLKPCDGQSLYNVYIDENPDIADIIQHTHIQGVDIIPNESRSESINNILSSYTPEAWEILKDRVKQIRITSYNVCYTKLLRVMHHYDAL